MKAEDVRAELLLSLQAAGGEPIDVGRAKHGRDTPTRAPHQEGVRAPRHFDAARRSVARKVWVQRLIVAGAVHGRPDDLDLRQVRVQPCAQALPRFWAGTASRVIGYPFVTVYANDNDDTTLCAACAEDARKGGRQPPAVTITAGTRECDYCFVALE